MARAPGRWPILGAALAEFGRESLVALRRLPDMASRRRVPGELLFAPHDLRTADPAFVDDVAAGLFVAGGKAVAIGSTSPFEAASPSPEWSADLYGLGWLRHLRAADSDAARALARRLVAEAIGPHRRQLEAGIGGRTTVAARRVVSLLAHSPLLLGGADHAFYRRILRRIGRDAEALGRAMRAAPVPLDRLVAAIGLSFAILSSTRLEGRLRRADRALEDELEAQILADGGHVSRNPSVLIELLLDVLPLRLLYASRGVEAPPALDRAVDRMLPMVRFFRHGNGELALFNGMGLTPSADLARLLSHDGGRTLPPRRAVPSGYDRLEAGPALVLVDVGGAPPIPSSAEAHLGCLAFELSSGLNRLVVNCGAPAVSGPLREASRLTAAHSTLALGGRSGGAVLDREAPGRAAGFLFDRFGPVLADGPRAVGSERGQAEGDEALAGFHDGYRTLGGATHSRRLRLARDGRRLDGLDEVAFAAAAGGSRSDEGRPGARLRFHLHPSVKAAPGDDGTVLLTCPDGETWRFRAAAETRLDASVFFAVSEGRRRTAQIVVEPEPPEPGRRLSIAWSFAREG